MFAKLALRNVKRQIGNYLIYFITVSLTVALMFAINNVIFSPQLQEYAVNIPELRNGLLTLTVLLSLIVALVLGYATSFMLKLRKREFGTYLTLGMTRKNILCLFILRACFSGGISACGDCTGCLCLSGANGIAKPFDGICICFFFLLSFWVAYYHRSHYPGFLCWLPLPLPFIYNECVSIS